MRIGIVGRGPWGCVYAATLRKMGIDHRQMSRNWSLLGFDAMIVASTPKSHYSIAMQCIQDGMPVLIEKPICTDSREAMELIRAAKIEDCPIVFAGHTRLYSTAWRAFKAEALAEGVRSVDAVAGGGGKNAPLWDWGPHLVAMCLDLGFDPLAAQIATLHEDHPLEFTVNGNRTFNDVAEHPTPLEVLLTEFMAAIDKDEPDVRGLELGCKVIEKLEAMAVRGEPATTARREVFPFRRMDD